ncbi:MAG: ATP-dependent zinc metalloprotease FtsH, partial [Kiloniellales bacterium]
LPVILGAAARLGRDMRKTWTWLVVALGLFLLLNLMLMSGRLGDSSEPAANVSYTEFKTLLSEKQVQSVILRGDQLEGRLVRERPLGQTGMTTRRFAARIPAFGDPDLLPALEAQGVEITVKEAADDGAVSRFLYGLLPWLLIIAVYLFFWNRMYGRFTGGFGSRDIDSFLTGSAKQQEKQGKRVTFADVAGQDNAKREVAELVDFLRDPERYTTLGAEVPHGVLMAGPPGTGKTLLARALAGEADVPFFHISASEFIEMFVGVGASRVRKMFNEAKKKAPSIIFIDELDAVGRVRGAGLGGGHDEREQTLNQILSELDGFAGHEAVVVLAATNRPDVLDPALLRPGRFDRHVILELPDLKARQAILEVHTRKIPLAADVDLATVAAGTPGFSGADLKNLVNEAAMLAASEKAKAVTARHLDEMRDKLLMGTVRTLAIRPEERHRLATHEAGHTAVAYFTPGADPLYKVTVIPRGRALGVTQQLPEEERHTLPEDYLYARLAVMLGGRAAERTLLGTVSSGADDDIRQATALARAMVSRWGMSKAVGPVDVRESEEHPFLGREIAQPRRFSEATAKAVDQAVGELVKRAEERAIEVIKSHRPAIERLIAELQRKETLGRSEIEACFGEPRSSVSVAAARRRA